MYGVILVIGTYRVVQNESLEGFQGFLVLVQSGRQQDRLVDLRQVSANMNNNVRIRRVRDRSEGGKEGSNKGWGAMRVDFPNV